MKYPITILYSVVLQTLALGAIIYGFLTDDLLFNIHLMTGLAVLGIATTGFTIFLVRIISLSTAKFWSIKTVLATLYNIINFVIFLGFILKAIIDWIGDPYQLTT
mgnify:CR=1 FL=1